MCCPVCAGSQLNFSPVKHLRWLVPTLLPISLCKWSARKFSQTGRRPYHNPLAIVRRVPSRVVFEVIENDSELTVLLLLKRSQHVVAMPSILLSAR